MFFIDDFFSYSNTFDFMYQKMDRGNSEVFVNKS